MFRFCCVAFLTPLVKIEEGGFISFVIYFIFHESIFAHMYTNSCCDLPPDHTSMKSPAKRTDELDKDDGGHAETVSSGTAEDAREKRISLGINKLKIIKQLQSCISLCVSGLHTSYSHFVIE